MPPEISEVLIDWVVRRKLFIQKGINLLLLSVWHPRIHTSLERGFKKSIFIQRGFNFIVKFLNVKKKAEFFHVIHKLKCLIFMTLIVVEL